MPCVYVWLRVSMVRFANAFGYWLAVGFGSGLIKPAPGTWGSLVGALLFWLLLSISDLLTWFILIIATLGGAWVCRIGGERLGEVDHGSIVWDEIVAMGWLLFVITQWQELTLFNVAIALFLFRVFDILKPFPINRVDAWHTPWGVMLDDLLAFAYAVICFFSLMYFIS
jgi:phosphatidylglycerophosphatase A